jgi:hypothetical protein
MVGEFADHFVGTAMSSSSFELKRREMAPYSRTVQLLNFELGIVSR